MSSGAEVVDIGAVTVSRSRRSRPVRRVVGGSLQTSVKEQVD
jgi:hypothetical protein